ncbi:3-deoxy-manno-octulosonate cytidylyltransferase [Sulfurovum sp.]|jgi:3-deoxy-manno-octulosonate cytidylyltransferase (CMP-KDO synthetase)|uniref:3-deoxy-manno-octulosonate cytidylyltransferase n=1 Tax=Sulfurovum sp. TaxID=1969726 RepID=UPI002A36EE19|nr:3-deoxy-manno-octulosonate cytidylyltransferase [Sulfurovum sp.]MDY0403617.1 3-deoxy-manno-octulosonate cytidylyltransferase [Sulfurovum sp.]
MRTVVIIPARLGSSRLPGKVLLDICGKPMIQHVYEAARKATKIDDVYIATDAEEVKDVCSTFTDKIIMTSTVHESGTDRLAEAIEKIDCDCVINVQGDEPLIDPKLIDALAVQMQASDEEMVSAMHKILSTSELKSPNAVKVTVDNRSYALYFSRSIIPHHRDDWEALLNHHETIPVPLRFYKHIGIYGYSTSFLKMYANLEQTYLEKLEKLEQLRVLENGFSIKMVETEYEPVGVDTLEDLERVKELMQCR